MDILNTGKYIYYNDTYFRLPIPSRTGHTFDGWFTERSNGTEITDNTIMNRTVNHTIYAHWIPQKVTINFNANGGYTSVSNKEVTYGYTFGTLPTPTRQGYSFDGWYLNGIKLTSESVVSIYYTQTVYAYWTKIG